MKNFKLIIILFFLSTINITLKAENKGLEKSKSSDTLFHDVKCNEGKSFPHHLQGISTNNKDVIYWSFTTQLVMTNPEGKILKQIPVVNHHGDLCYHDKKVYVAVNLGRFNDPKGNASSWVYIYNGKDLTFISKHEVPEVFHGAGGMEYYDGHFFVVGGLPNDIKVNYVYEYDDQFKFIKKHIVTSGHTHLGIQTAAFSNGKWWFGCYGSPRIMLVTDAKFNMLGRYEFDCSLGVVGLPDSNLLIASGICKKSVGCVGSVKLTKPEDLHK